MVCRDFILPEFCKPCLFLSSFQFAKIIVPYREKRKAAFCQGYIQPMIDEGRSLGLTGEELLAMVRKAIGEGE